MGLFNILQKKKPGDDKTDIKSNELTPNPRWTEMDEKIEIYKKLPVKEQLAIIESRAVKTDTIVGKIFISGKDIDCGLTDYSADSVKKRIAQLLGDAPLVKMGSGGGSHEIEFCWIYLVDKFLVGVSAISYSGGPVCAGGDHKVYLVDKKHRVEDLDMEKIEKELFNSMNYVNYDFLR